MTGRDEDELDVESYADREERWGESSFVSVGNDQYSKL